MKINENIKNFLIGGSIVSFASSNVIPVIHSNLRLEPGFDILKLLGNIFFIWSSKALNFSLSLWLLLHYFLLL